MIETAFEIGGENLFISSEPRVVSCPEHDIKVDDAGEIYVETFIDVELDVTLGLGGESVTFDYTTSYIPNESHGRKKLRWAGNIFDFQVDESKTDEQVRSLFSVELTDDEVKGLTKIIENYVPSLDSLGFSRKPDDYVYQVSGNGSKWHEYAEVKALKKSSVIHIAAMRPKTSHKKAYLQGSSNDIGGTSATIRFDPLLSYNAIEAIKKSLDMERIEGDERMAYLGFKVVEIRGAMSNPKSAISQSTTKHDQALINALEENYIRFL